MTTDSDTQTVALDDSKQEKLQTGSDLALDALSQASQSTPALSAAAGDDDQELADSDSLAETLASLQRVIERNAEQLDELGTKLKEKRQSLKNVFDNDSQLNEAQEQVATYSSQLKERKSKLQSDPQVTSLKVQIGEINEQKKEIEETLSNHLLNYYQLTNSTSFDTSDGDQWDFTVRAKVRPRKKAA